MKPGRLRDEVSGWAIFIPQGDDGRKVWTRRLSGAGFLNEYWSTNKGLGMRKKGQKLL